MHRINICFLGELRLSYSATTEYESAVNVYRVIVCGQKPTYYDEVQRKCVHYCIIKELYNVLM